MADPTEVYVDPSIAGNSGTGTSGDPYGDLQYALNTQTRDSTNGDRFNIKTGTAEVLSAQISLATYGTPTQGAPLVFQGYTSTAGDGGIGVVNCNSNSFISDDTLSALWFIDLEIYGSGAATNLFDLNDDCGWLNCELHDANTLVRCDTYCLVYGCYLYDADAYGTEGTTATRFIGNYYANGTKDFNQCIRLGAGGMASFNIMSIDGSTDGIIFVGKGGYVFHNSILSNGGTGTGIEMGVSQRQAVIEKNLVEGFSGAGGDGIDLYFATGRSMHVFRNNAVYNCTTAYQNPLETVPSLPYTDNETLSASPFQKNGSDTFANRFSYFAPVDTGNVIKGAVNVFDKGAVGRPWEYKHVLKV